jgi:beta-mannosidase
MTVRDVGRLATGATLMVLGTQGSSRAAISAVPPPQPPNRAAASPAAAPPAAGPAPGAPAPAGSRSVRELAAGWSFRRAPTAGSGGDPWLPATVPGCVHTDLLAAGKIGEPFFRLNEKDQQWIEKEDWDYRTVIRADAELLARERVELVFAGLDTYADVLLNGAPVLSASNMFRSWRANAKPHLRPGDNELLVRFRSPVARVKAAYDGLGYRLPAVNDQATEMVSMFTRKAPYHYGWDWGPRFVTSGVWRPVTLESWDEARLDDVQVWQDHLDAAAAKLTVKVRVAAARAGRATVSVGVAGGAPAAPVAVNLRAGMNDVSVPLRIDRPERWWPRGLGPQRLYTIEARLSGAGGVARDQRRTRVGLRTVEVVHQRDQAGKSFFVKVNGAPVFMKGANWIPADSFVTRMTAERYRFLLQSAADVNMNMLRVWGGGIYEDDRFYDLADELGLLVFQDFMFACSMYPGDPAFLDNVRQEAVENVRRLRNHASLALWAGNNEIEAAWHGWGWQTKFKLTPAAEKQIWGDYQKLFHDILPAVVAAEDRGRFYTRSSPSANDDKVPANKRNWGDMHYWGVWHSEHPYTSYADNVSRFMSEYGFQSFPELGTVARYTAPGSADWNIEGPVMLAHQRHPRGNTLIRTYMDRDFRRPKDFASFLNVGQVLQATVIKFAAEVHRRKMGHNWGSLYWQLDDCWPVASWSGIDYYGRWKALHHFARRFFAPVLVSPVEEKGAVEVWGISDRWSDTPAVLTARLIDFSGRELWRKQQDVVLAANASRALLAMPRAQALGGANPAEVVLVTDLVDKATGQRLSRNTLSFAKTKDLALPKPELTVSVEPDNAGAFTIKVSARRLARNVYLSTTDAAGVVKVDGAYDDNYFDLLPGENAAVNFRPAAPTTAEALRAALRAVTIADTY